VAVERHAQLQEGRAGAVTASCEGQALADASSGVQRGGSSEADDRRSAAKPAVNASSSAEAVHTHLAPETPTAAHQSRGTEHAGAAHGSPWAAARPSPLGGSRRWMGGGSRGARALPPEVEEMAEQAPFRAFEFQRFY
jgi:hypothetical protein